MDYLELLLAAEVRTLAKSQQLAAQTKELNQSTTGLRPEEQAIWKQTWIGNHPLSEFVPAALDELKAIAKLMRES